MADPKQVSVVIPTKDGGATLPELLSQLFASRPPFELEAVVVDSGSSDETLDVLSQYPVAVHRIPPSEFDHGETRNLGIRQSSGEVIVLFTQDAIPASPDFLERMVRPFRDPLVAGVYGRQIPRPNCDVVTRRQLEDWLTGRIAPARAELAGRSLVDLEPHERHRLCAFDNVCSAVRRSDWERIPFPRASFAEDLAWGKRVIEAGRAIAYEPRAAVVHSHRRSVLYEYRRTRRCHASLHELFGLATLPRRRDVLRAALTNLRRDLPYVHQTAPPGAERFRQLARIAGLSVLWPLGQYHGIRDARRGAF
jgi:rhamnosyltransferase